MNEKKLPKIDGEKRICLKIGEDGGIILLMVPADSPEKDNEQAVKQFQDFCAKVLASRRRT